MTELEAAVRTEIARWAADLTGTDATEAVVSASRRALLVAVPRLQDELDAATAAQAGLSLPVAPTRPPGRAHNVLVIVALLLGMLAPAMVLPARNGTAFDVGDGAIWMGGWALASVICFALAARDQLRSKYLNPRVNGSRAFILFAAIWAVTLVYAVTHWGDVDRYEPLVPIIGTVLLAASTIGMVVLWTHARQVERDYQAQESARAESGEPRDPLKKWWSNVAGRLTPGERGAADRSYRFALAALVDDRIIVAGDAQRLKRRKPPSVWAGSIR
ncbi:hypothetical protein IF188_19915 [Microbacterium sp. NEAU-LLC]|uniref:Uncharacterized protein n=1 Tax=Microbacterium helvum TaxID=2773713 RepID=A0ABR8NVB4_9MICO|nr:hypothetical protein [Microbacterium helvum]MBD3943963.1 hypothetical protein [Microbacterium helvum]